MSVERWLTFLRELAMNKYFLIGFAALCAAAAAPANAETVQVRINFADLDLSSNADVAKLRKRVRLALKKACAAPLSMANSPAIDTCVTDALAQADTQIARHRGLALAMVMSPGG